MITTVILSVCIVALAVIEVIQIRRLDKVVSRLSKMALKVHEIEKTVNSIDQSTGKSIFMLQTELRTFKEEFGDAAIEEMKKTAEAQKAFADGLNNIMEFGADLYGRGDSK